LVPWRPLRAKNGKQFGGDVRAASRDTYPAFIQSGEGIGASHREAGVAQSSVSARADSRQNVRRHRVAAERDRQVGQAGNKKVAVMGAALRTMSGFVSGLRRR